MICTFISSWFLLNKSTRRNLRRGLGSQRRIRSMIVTSHIQGTWILFSLSFDKGFPTKVPPMLFQSSTKILCLTLSLKEDMVVDIHCLCLVVLGIE